MDNDIKIMPNGEIAIDAEIYCTQNRITRRSLYNWIKSGKVKTIKEFKKIYVLVSKEKLNFLMSSNNLERRKLQDEEVLSQLNTIHRIVGSLIESLSGKRGANEFVS